MEYILLFLTDGVLGYFLQGVGFLMGVYAFVKRRVVAREFIPMAVLYALIGFGVRQIRVISFGFHTILIMIAFILLAVLILKTPAFMTVVGILAASMTILLSELINLAALSGVLGHDQIMKVMDGDGTASGEISKAVAGTPVNLILVAAMFMFYKIRMRSKEERDQDGKTGAQVGAEDRNGTKR